MDDKQKQTVANKIFSLLSECKENPQGVGEIATKLDLAREIINEGISVLLHDKKLSTVKMNGETFFFAK